MAETIYTKDGKCHTLLGSTTPVSIIRDYCGDEVIRALRRNVSAISEQIENVAECSKADIEDVNAISNMLEEIRDIFI